MIKRHLVFNSGGYLTSETLNYGSTPSEPTTYARDAASNFVTDKTDALGRETEYGYDFTTTKVGDLLSVTGNATGTPITTTFAYTPTFHVLKTITDPRQAYVFGLLLGWTITILFTARLARESIKIQRRSFCGSAFRSAIFRLRGKNCDLAFIANINE